jgi:hypothetical protein
MKTIFDKAKIIEEKIWKNYLYGWLMDIKSTYPYG